MNSILVIAPHPDDETLGCGGTLLKHKARGDKIHWLIGTEINKELGYSKEQIKLRKKEIGKVSSLFKFDSINFLGLTSTKVDEYKLSEIIKKISKIITKTQPNTIYLPFKGDVHSDHRIIFNAAYSCTKSFRYPFVKKIYMMETLSETEFSPSTKEDSFIPNIFVDISAFLEKKIDIMSIFKSEMGSPPFPRSKETIRALATVRGSTVNCLYAESFMLLKEIL